MSAQQKFLLAVFYLCAFLALFAPVASAYSNDTVSGNQTQTNGTQTPSNTTNPHVPSKTHEDSSAVAIQLSSTVALFGALVAAAVFAI